MLEVNCDISIKRGGFHMVSSMKRETFTLAISLLLVVISLTGVAMAAPPNPPIMASPYKFYPAAAFSGTPGKMAQDITGNLYVTDYWAQGIWKFDKRYQQLGFIKTDSRPVGVAVAASGQLVVSMQAPRAYVAFYNQDGFSANAQAPYGNELGVLGASFYRPSGVTVDAAGKIYVVEAGDLGTIADPNKVNVFGLQVTGNVPKVKVFDSNGNLLGQFGNRSPVGNHDTVLGNFSEPQGVAYEKVSNRIYVADSLNGRVQIFGAWNGTSCPPIGQFGGIDESSSATVHTPSPQNVSFEYDAAGLLARIYVADRARHRVQVTDQTGGVLLATIGNSIPGSDLNYPNDVLFASGIALVSSAATGNPANIEAFGIDGATVPPPPDCNVKMNPRPPHNLASGSSMTLSGTVVANAACQVTLQVNSGALVNASVNQGTGNWSVTIPAANFTASLYNTITAKGFVTGNNAMDSFDTAQTWYGALSTLGSPTLTVSPAPARYVNTLTYTIQGGTTATGFAQAPVYVDVNNTVAASTIFASSSQVGANGSWSANVVLTEGDNTVCVTAWQKGLDPSKYVTQCFTITADMTAPDLTGTTSFLPANSTTTQAVANLSGVVTEKNLQGVTVTVNGTASAAKGLVAVGGSGTYFSAPVLLRRGVNTVSVVATDLSGNSSPAEVHTVTLVPELPGGLTASPVDNMFVKGLSTMTFTGKVDLVNGACPSVMVAGRFPAQLDASCNWSAAVDLRTGLVEYGVTATPVTGTAISLNRTITDDAAAANLRITDPPADTAVTAASYTVKGLVDTTGVSSVTVTVTGDDASVQTPTVTMNTDGPGTFRAPVSFAAGQQNYSVKVKVLMTDSSTSTTFRNIIYDTAAPSFSIAPTKASSPTALLGNVDANSKLEATGKDGSNNTVSVPLTFDAYNQQNNGIVWHANTAGLTNISFKVTKPAGNNITVNFTPVPSAVKMPVGDLDNNNSTNIADAMLCLRVVAAIQTSGYDPAQLDIAPAIYLDPANPDQGYVVGNAKADIFDCQLILRKNYGLVTFLNQ
jgi:glucodextranase-like protein/NHL repeat-containing protein